MTGPGKPKVLIVDDILMNIEFLVHIIRSLEIDIITATSSYEALEKIRDVDLALALLDIPMPGMDGIELAHRINGIPERGMIPIIFITAYPSDEEELERYYSSGIVDFLLKPFRPGILLSKVKIFLELYRQKHQILLTERMAAIGEMATNIAHEINQPLNTITLILENLLAETEHAHTSDPDYFRNKTNRIFENIARINRIIDHIRTFTGGSGQYLPVPFNLNDSIRNALNMITEQFNLREIGIRFQPAENLPQVTGNTYAFEQVILNLMINARDGLGEKEKLHGSFPKFIEIQTLYEDEVIQVKIRDNGQGIKPEDLPNVIQPFYTTKRPGAGTGLGLAISFNIIRGMQGDINIQSEYGSGTTVVIFLPVLVRIPVVQEMAS